MRLFIGTILMQNCGTVEGAACLDNYIYTDVRTCGSKEKFTSEMVASATRLRKFSDGWKIGWMDTLDAPQSLIDQIKSSL